ncbi:type II toxin-antitoxin system Phd/YefM family antitoxin [Corynebacterium sp. Marseille-P4321]|uniref:type II toxin-antitoxin system Phd/YefM family antitoxin n=1 Tax=Corynebacterium sp. Marseille-P4321 TaxID=2736603 RepID=UPI001589645C|nr:type II toxin-antitoxin system prevent-host-death family antitoxin [Corynebacterium sp. Marseille-P4321]
MGVEERLRELLTDHAGIATVSMRELNQKTRAVIDRVMKEGIALTVTDRGRPIAEIHPVSQKTGLDRLDELGLLEQRGKPFEVDWEPIQLDFTLEELLESERGEDRLERVMADLRALDSSRVDEGKGDE